MTLAMFFFFFYLYAGFSICWFNYEDGLFSLMDMPGDCCSAGVRLVTINQLYKCTYYTFTLKIMDNV